MSAEPREIQIRQNPLGGWFWHATYAFEHRTKSCAGKADSFDEALRTVTAMVVEHSAKAEGR